MYYALNSILNEHLLCTQNVKSTFPGQGIIVIIRRTKSYTFWGAKFNDINVQFKIFKSMKQWNGINNWEQIWNIGTIVRLIREGISEGADVWT